jgi:hypothetical protein
MKCCSGAQSVPYGFTRFVLDEIAQIRKLKRT